MAYIALIVTLKLMARITAKVFFSTWYISPYPYLSWKPCAALESVWLKCPFLKIALYYRFSAKVGDLIWLVTTSHLRCSRIAVKSSITDNDFRSPKVRLLYSSVDQSVNDLFGDGGVWVRRIENGVEYNWDITRSMFSAGNISEKIRIAEIDCEGSCLVAFTTPNLNVCHSCLLILLKWECFMISVRS